MSGKGTGWSKARLEEMNGSRGGIRDAVDRYMEWMLAQHHVRVYPSLIV